MKKVTTFLTVLACIFTLIGCKNQSASYTDEPSITGTVTDITEHSVLIENETGEYRVSLDVENKDSVTQLNVGDEIVIYYNGDIAETYPAKIDTVYAIILK